MEKEKTTKTIAKKAKKNICLSCGTESIKPGRRYCSPDCRKQILWVLSLSNGLLRVFSARYAAFSFDDRHVILDILPTWSRDVSRFVCNRRSFKKPAQDLKQLILKSGEEWYNIINNNNSMSYASLFLLNRNCNKKLHPESIKPLKRMQPRFSKDEKESIRLLNLELNEIMSEKKISNIKAAYKKLAKIHHPDVGGDTEEFKKLNDAHQQMLSWAEHPQFSSRKALIGCWSYDASTGRWAPPL